MLERAETVNELTPAKRKDRKKDLLKYFRCPPSVEPALTELQARFNWKAKDLRTAVHRCPKLLSMSAEQIKRGLDALQTQLELDDEQLAKLVTTIPSVACMRPDRNLIPRVRWLCAETGFTAPELGAAVVEGCMSLLIRSLDNSIKPRFHQMKSLGMPSSSIIRRISYTDKKYEIFMERAKSGDACFVANWNDAQYKEEPLASCIRCRKRGYTPSAST
eukprot:342180-Pleurochrysis_carterae.AAC.2